MTDVMKELFREPDITRVNYFRAILEEEGIPTLIRNEYLTYSGLTEIPIPEFYPALCVMDDADYQRAVEIIRENLAMQREGADTETRCPSCGETNPGNFGTCWSCGQPIPGP